MAPLNRAPVSGREGVPEACGWCQGWRYCSQEPRGELAPGQLTGWVPQWTANVIPPTPLITVCVCPVGTRPSEGLWAKRGEPCPPAPPASPPGSQCSCQLPPGNRKRRSPGGGVGWAESQSLPQKGRGQAALVAGRVAGRFLFSGDGSCLNSDWPPPLG